MKNDSKTIVPRNGAKRNDEPAIMPGRRGRFLSVVFEREEADRYRRQLADFLKAEALLNRAVLLIDEAKCLGAIVSNNDIAGEVSGARDMAFEALAAVRDELANKTRQVRLIEERELPAKDGK